MVTLDTTVRVPKDMVDHPVAAPVIQDLQGKEKNILDQQDLPAHQEKEKDTLGVLVRAEEKELLDQQDHQDHQDLPEKVANHGAALAQVKDTAVHLLAALAGAAMEKVNQAKDTVVHPAA